MPLQRVLAGGLLLALTVTGAGRSQTSRSPSASQRPAAAHADWAEVEQVAPDESIGVLEKGRQQPVFCRMDVADDTMLFCIGESRFMPARRIVFPQRRVAEVFRVEIFYGPSGRSLLIASGIGGLFGGLAGGKASVGTGFAGAGIGALIGLGAASAPRPFPLPNRRLHLVYRAP